jgi:hypothetical protein
MKALALVLLLPVLGGCVAKAIVDTAVTAVTLPVKVASKAVDVATTSQAEADQNRGRELRKEDERRGRDARDAAERCRNGKPLPTDLCSPQAAPR